MKRGRRGAADEVSVGFHDVGAVRSDVALKGFWRPATERLELLLGKNILSCCGGWTYSERMAGKIICWDTVNEQYGLEMFLEPETSDGAVRVICKKRVGGGFRLWFPELKEGQEGLVWECRWLEVENVNKVAFLCLICLTFLYRKGHGFIIQHPWGEGEPNMSLWKNWIPLR